MISVCRFARRGYKWVTKTRIDLNICIFDSHCAPFAEPKSNANIRVTPYGGTRVIHARHTLVALHVDRLHRSTRASFAPHRPSRKRTPVERDLCSRVGELAQTRDGALTASIEPVMGYSSRGATHAPTLPSNIS